MRISNLLLSISLFILPAFSSAQQSITVEDIWQSYRFFPSGVPGFNFQKDGEHYTLQNGQQILQFNFAGGQQTAVLFDANALPDDQRMKGRMAGYTFSEDETRILLWTGTERIFRHSSRSFYYVWDGEELQEIFSKGKIQLATFDPTGRRVAFVYANNMYIRDLETGELIQLTDDGAFNEIINGAPDWVYEEEFSFARAFAWSPEGEKIAYYRFDERPVPEFTYANYRDGSYPEYVTYKYPKVGEENSTVSIHVYHLENGKTVDVGFQADADYYIPRIRWTEDPSQLCVFKMNRHQNELELLLADARSGQTKLLMREVNPYYLEAEHQEDLVFLDDGQHFLWSSEQDGWKHLYLYNMKGEQVRQITKGEWDVTDFYGIDQENELLYFQAAAENPMNREVYSIGLDGKKRKRLSGESGWYSATFSRTYEYYMLSYSNANTPPVYTVYNSKGKALRVLENNADLRSLQEAFGVTPVEFFQFETNEGVSLNGYMIKPADFDPKKEYPLLMCVYGGPNSQRVVNRIRGQNYWWFQMLAQQGFIVACVDGRGTGARGQEFRKMTYLQLGKYETADQIEAARYLGSQSYIDQNRIGIFGWSYGGYLSSLCLLKGNSVFKAAIAVAPVTNWKWYDTIYAERYMRTEEENPEGYRDNAPVYFADRLKGEYLLMHGMGDDNVHFQHSVEMANALIAANKQFDTYYYPNRAHGIYGRNGRLHLYTKMTNFLKEKLMDNFWPVDE